MCSSAAALGRAEQLFTSDKRSLMKVFSSADQLFRENGVAELRCLWRLGMNAAMLITIFIFIYTF